MKTKFPKANKKTMTLNITEQEMVILEKLAGEKGVTKTALIRQALRLYQTIDEKLKNGEDISCLQERSSLLKDCLID